MLKFLAFKDGVPTTELDVKPFYLIGPDEVSVRAQIRFADGLIICQKQTEEAAALAVLWEVKGAGKFLLQTTRLPDREKPYILNVEMARWRLMRILQKLEDWGLFGYPQIEKITTLLEDSRKLFIRALQNDSTPAKAADLADQSLQLSLEGGEALARFHAMRMLGPRVQGGGLSKKVFGCRLSSDLSTDQLSPDILGSLNFVQIPISWSELQPARQQFNMAPLDRWFEFLMKHRVTIRLGSVLSFTEAKIPIWLRGKNIEFELIRDLVYEYLTAIANRYGKYIRSWNILSGIHADNYFNLNFEQILDISRLASARAKQLCPRATSLIEIIHPWGEYYANNPRSIHPFLYADMVSQSGINFDAFSLRLPFGAPSEGMYLRDFFQMSSLLDRYALLGKPLHITTCVPSQVSDDPEIADALAQKAEAGYWENPWSPEIQARWFELFCQVALSKPQVDSITWAALGDSVCDCVPFSGLFTKTWTGKPVFVTLRELQKRLYEARTKT
ncbi:MAG: hypothetical protein WC975_06230 [Phycisphaerae bacterium]